MSLDGIRWQVRRLPDVSQVASSSGRGSVCNGNRGKESLVRENSRGVSRWEFSLDGGWYVRGFRYLILWLASSGFSTCFFFFFFLKRFMGGFVTCEIFWRGEILQCLLLHIGKYL